MFDAYFDLMGHFGAVVLWDSISVPHAGRAAHLISNEDKSVLGGHTCTRMGGL